MQNKFQYTFGGKFFTLGEKMFGGKKEYPSSGINQPELVNESRYFILYHPPQRSRFITFTHHDGSCSIALATLIFPPFDYVRGHPDPY